VIKYSSMKKENHLKLRIIKLLPIFTNRKRVTHKVSTIS
jgi:hypothetical protein